MKPMLDPAGRLELSDEPSRLRLLAAGDLCHINRLDALLAAGDVRAAFGDCLPLFARANLAVVNLESPLCRCESPIVKSGPNFRAAPEIAGALVAAGVDVCCLANNHILDQGPGGLAETLAALDAAGLRHLGAGPDEAAAAAPLVVDVAGRRMALLNFAEGEFCRSRGGPGAAGLDPVANCRAVAEAAGSADLAIVFVHTGHEQTLFPSSEVRRRCREFIDAGAAAVVAHHPHVPQGIEVRHGRPIVYSLGNFLFDWQGHEPETETSFLLELELGRSGVAALAVHPIRKSPVGGAGLLAGAERAACLEFLNELSAPLADESLAARLWEEQARMLLASRYAPLQKRLLSLAGPAGPERRRALVTALNLFQCEAHREAMEHALRLSAVGRLAPDNGLRARLEELMARLKAFAPAKAPS
jgi:poly-gamma-glutamate synthesis protein (capsule biosynthesis protein)